MFPRPKWLRVLNIISEGIESLIIGTIRVWGQVIAHYWQEVALEVRKAP